MLFFVNLIITWLQKPKVLLVFKAGFAFVLLYFAGLLLHYHYFMTAFPYPIIYREGTMMATTSQLLHGIIPYHFVDEPPYTNGYGFGYPLLVLPFAATFGNTLIIHRAVTALFIFASCAVIGFVLHKKRAHPLLNLWAILTLYASLLFPLTSTPTVDPASTGMFFMLLTIFIPYFCNYSLSSLVISICFGGLAYYTKAYFLLGIPVMASYLFLLVSKKKAILYGAAAFLCFVVSVLIMNHFFPSYFDDCFFINYNISAQTTMMLVLVRQLHQFADLHLGVIIVVSIIMVYSLVHWLVSGRFKAIANDLKVITQMPIDIFAGIFFAAVLVLSMGKHYGANLWYFFQLFSPFLVIMVAELTGRFKLWPVLFSFLLIYNLYSLTAKDDYKFFVDSKTGWKTIEMLIKSNVSIFNSSLTAPLLIQENKEIYDDGAEFYAGGGKRTGFFAKFLKDDPRVINTEVSFFQRVQSMIQYKQFDLIMIEAGYASVILPKAVANYYKVVGSIFVFAPQDRRIYMMTVWKPI